MSELTSDPIFRIGDIAQLKSGGPFVTITKADDFGDCDYIFFNTTTGGFEKGRVDERCLRHAHGKPIDPEGSEKMRSTSVTKSSLS